MSHHEHKNHKHSQKVNEPLSGSKKVKNKNHSRQNKHASHDM